MWILKLQQCSALVGSIEWLTVNYCECESSWDWTPLKNCPQLRWHWGLTEPGPNWFRFWQIQFTMKMRCCWHWRSSWETSHPWLEALNLSTVCLWVNIKSEDNALRDLNGRFAYYLINLIINQSKIRPHWNLWRPWKRQLFGTKLLSLYEPFQLSTLLLIWRPILSLWWSVSPRVTGSLQERLLVDYFQCVTLEYQPQLKVHTYILMTPMLLWSFLLILICLLLNEPYLLKNLTIFFYPRRWSTKSLQKSLSRWYSNGPTCCG